jgi:hypothetical protein
MFYYLAISEESLVIDAEYFFIDHFHCNSINSISIAIIFSAIDRGIFRVIGRGGRFTTEF